MNFSPDIMVVGGGGAGIAAAIAASKAGADTILVEKSGVLGGTATSAWVGTICGLYEMGGDTPIECCGGFPTQFARSIAKSSSSVPIKGADGLWILPYRPAAFQQVAAKVVGDSTVAPMLHATVTDVSTGGGRIESLDVLWWEQKCRLTPRVIIDCSGESIVSRLAGIPTISPDNFQAAAMVFELRGVDLPDERTCGFYLLSELQRGVQSGSFPAEGQRVSLIPGHATSTSLLVKLGISKMRDGKLGEVSAIQQHALEIISTIVAYLNAGGSPLKDVVLAGIAPQVGIRTGNRLEGTQTLTREDVVNLRKFHNGIARSAWPIEEWLDHKRPVMTYLPDGGSYEIPAGSLRSSAVSNLFGAGRAISADDGAIASARVIGTCLQTGWAAGRLAVGALEKTSEEKATISRIRIELGIPPSSR